MIKERNREGIAATKWGISDSDCTFERKVLIEKTSQFHKWMVRFDVPALNFFDSRLLCCGNKTSSATCWFEKGMLLQIWNERFKNIEYFLRRLGRGVELLLTGDAAIAKLYLRFTH